MAKKKKAVEFDVMCHYCENAMPLQDREFMLCKRDGVVSSFHKCRRFSYDPLKRVPPPPKSVEDDELPIASMLEGL